MFLRVGIFSDFRSAFALKKCMKKNRLTIFIIIAMALGVIVGYMVHVNSSPEYIKKFADNIKLLTTIFLRLVQMIIAPLVFCTLVVGIAKLGDLKSVGRVGGKAMLWFVSASLVSLSTVSRSSALGTTR